MPNIFVRSTDGNNADDGLTWANAKQTIAGGLAAASAGDTIYVSKDHNFTTTANITYTSPGTASNPVKILCVDDTGDPVSPTTLLTTAREASTEGMAFDFGTGFSYVYGLKIEVGDGTSRQNADIDFDQTGSYYWKLEQCALYLNTTDTQGQLELGTTTSGGDSDSRIDFIDCSFKFAGVNPSIVARTKVNFIGGSIDATGAAPTVLFEGENSLDSRVLVDGMDLSPLGTGKSLVDVGFLNFNQTSEYRFTNCKLGSGVLIASGTIQGPGGPTVEVWNCDSADTNTRFYVLRYSGSVREELAIKRTGGAEQNHNGSAVGYSMKMTTNADVKFVTPLESPPIPIWNDTTGSSQTATVEIVNDGDTLTDEEIWLEVSYPGTAGFPVYGRLSDRKANILATSANQATSAVAWTTTGLITPIKQKLEVSFTAQQQGYVVCRVYLAKASKSVYVDPKVAIT